MKIEDAGKLCPELMDTQLVTRTRFFGQELMLICDGNCHLAWGNNWHGEKGETAPDDPGTYEGGHAKPNSKYHKKWCARECDRSRMEDVE